MILGVFPSLGNPSRRIATELQFLRSSQDLHSVSHQDLPQPTGLNWRDPKSVLPHDTTKTRICDHWHPISVLGQDYGDVYHSSNLIFQQTPFNRIDFLEPKPPLTDLLRVLKPIQNSRIFRHPFAPHLPPNDKTPIPNAPITQTC